MAIFVFLCLLFLVTGASAGILSALYGAGGGVVVVPIIFLLFHVFQQVPSAVAMHVSVGTSLAVMTITSLNSFYNHLRHGHVLWPLVNKMAVFLLLGILCGIILANFMHSDFLRWLFILMLLYVFLQALFKKGFVQAYRIEDFRQPANWILRFVSFGIGLLAVMLGVGGSVMTVPFLRHYHLPMVNASAVAVTLTPLVALIGTIGYFIAGSYYVGQLPSHCFGFIYVPAFFGIAFGTLLGVPIGVRLSEKIPDVLLAKLFLVLLLTVIFSMLV